MFPPSEVRTTRLPQLADSGLYYSAIAEGDRNLRDLLLRCERRLPRYPVGGRPEARVGRAGNAG